jgi:hypothetical protein
MNWLQPIDLYCERLTSAFWAEPLNALSNLSFVLAALWALQSYRKGDRRDPVFLGLTALAALVGVGSFLFHTFANLWSSFADVIPIWTFVALYVLIAVIRLTGRAPARVLGVALGVGAGVMGVLWITLSGGATDTGTMPDPLNGSGRYAPAVIALFVFAGMTWRRGHVIAPWVVASALTFAVSLVFRTVDLSWCEATGIGTHFLWHLLNGVMVALLLQAMLRMPARNLP